MPAAPLIRKHGANYGGPEQALRWLRVFYVLGRLEARVSIDAASQELTRVMRTADMKDGPEPPQAVVLTPIAQYLIGPAGPVLWTLLAGATLMLAIACANVAGLQVSRSTRRQRSLAIRAALGASGRRLLMQMLVESALVTAMALAGAALVAAVLARVLVLLAPVSVPRLDTVDLLSGPVVAFGAAATFLTVLLCGVWPALAARGLSTVRVLAHGPSAAADPRGRRIQRAVVVVQIAVALTLLAGTALFLRTLRALDRTVLGFDPEQLLAASVSPATGDLARWNTFYDALLARVAALPNVAATGAVALRPLSGPIGWDSQPMYPGQVLEQPVTWGLNPHTNLEIVTPGYFETMGIRLLRGRVFQATDTTSAPGVVIVSERAAQRLWPGREALGQRLRDPSYRTGQPGSPTGWQTVIGVVADVRYRGLNDVRLDLYLPATQSSNRVQQLMVRTRGNPADLVASIRAAARAIDPSAGVSEATLMSEAVAAESAPRRFLTRVFVAFAVLAGALAAIGLGAVIALTVASRQRELAIRAALGANRARLRALILREGLTLVVFGIALGLPGALTLANSVEHVLVGVSPFDVPALTLATSLVSLIGLVANWLPARRAADADPLDALRVE